MRPATAVIDLAALRHNLAVARQRAGSARLVAVVKADGYGHGAARLLPALARLAAHDSALVRAHAVWAVRRIAGEGAGEVAARLAWAGAARLAWAGTARLAWAGTVIVVGVGAGGGAVVVCVPLMVRW